MVTVAHRLSKLLPKSLVFKMRPFWHRICLSKRYFLSGGRIKFSWKLQCLIASKCFKRYSEKRMTVVIRSFRELMRWMQFAEGPDSKFFDWLASLKKESVFWDVGASNGLEGFYVHHMAQCKIVFIEPYTPSIESIMKTAYLQQEMKNLSSDEYEIIQLACSDHECYEKLVTHTKPVAGENYNSVEHGIENYCQGGRQKLNQSIAQWVYCLPLDDLHFKHHVQLPTHLKIDVDGLEVRVLEGAQKLLSEKKLQECVVEVNDHNGPLVIDLMNQYGFEKYDEYIHCNTDEAFTADYFFRK